MIGGLLPFNRLQDYFYHISYYKEINYNVNLIEVFRWIAQAILFIPLIIILCIDSKVSTDENGKLVIGTDFNTNLSDLQVFFITSYSAVLVVNLFCLVRIFSENENYNRNYDNV